MRIAATRIARWALPWAIGAAVALGTGAVVPARVVAAVPATGTPAATVPRSTARSGAAISVTAVIGPVSMLRGGTVSARVTPGTKLHAGDVITTELNAKATMQLPQGRLTLYSASSLRIGRVDAAPGSSTVNVALRAGEATIETPAANTAQSEIGISTPVLTRAVLHNGACVVSVAGDGSTGVLVMRNRAFVQGKADAGQRAVSVGYSTRTDVHGRTSAPTSFRIADVAQQLVGLQGISIQDATGSGFGGSLPRAVLLVAGWILAIVGLRVAGRRFWHRGRVR